MQNPIQLYREGDTPEEKEKEIVISNGMYCTGISVLSIFSLGSIGLPLLSPIGLLSLGCAAIGFGLCGYDYVSSSDRWEEEALKNSKLISADPNDGVIDVVNDYDSKPVDKPKATLEYQTKVTLTEDSNKFDFKALDNPDYIKEPVKPSYAQTGDDIARSLAEKLKSTLIVGQPGAGKGFTVMKAIEEIKRLHPDIMIWVIDPKSDPNEKHYWRLVDRYLPLNLATRPFISPEEMVDICEEAMEFIEEFQQLNSPKLLIFDEALAVKEKAPKWFNQLMTGFNSLCSMGRSIRQYGWLISQSPNTSDFGISGGVRNVYRRILLISKEDLGLLDNGSTFFSGRPNENLLNKTGRVFYDSSINGWGSVPVYKVTSDPVVPVANPKPEPKPGGQSRRVKLNKDFEIDLDQKVEDLITQLTEEAKIDIQNGGDKEKYRKLITELKGMDTREKLTRLEKHFATKRVPF